MKTPTTKAELTLGEFIVKVFDTCNKHTAAGIVWLSAQTHLVVFRDSEIPKPRKKKT